MSNQRLNRVWDIVSSVAGGIADASSKGSCVWIEGKYFERQTPAQVFKREIAVSIDALPHKIDLRITNEPEREKRF